MYISTAALGPFSKEMPVHTSPFSLLAKVTPHRINLFHRGYIAVAVSPPHPPINISLDIRDPRSNFGNPLIAVRLSLLRTFLRIPHLVPVPSIAARGSSYADGDLDARRTYLHIE